jgi:HSP20 family protein
MTKLPPSQSIKGELEQMRREMDRIWDRFSNELSSSTAKQDWNPSLNLAETENSLMAELEVPGINPEDIDVSVTGEMLTVEGEKKQEASREDMNYHLLERVYGKFSRSIKLPTRVDPERVQACYKDGILQITMAKPQTVKSKRIEVKTA